MPLLTHSTKLAPALLKERRYWWQLIQIDHTRPYYLHSTSHPTDPATFLRYPLTRHFPQSAVESKEYQIEMWAQWWFRSAVLVWEKHGGKDLELMTRKSRIIEMKFCHPACHSSMRWSQRASLSPISNHRWFADEEGNKVRDRRIDFSIKVIRLVCASLNVFHQACSHSADRRRYWRQLIQIDADKTLLPS